MLAEVQQPAQPLVQNEAQHKVRVKGTGCLAKAVPCLDVNEHKLIHESFQCMGIAPLAPLGLSSR